MYGKLVLKNSLGLAVPQTENQTPEQKDETQNVNSDLCLVLHL